MVNHWPHRKVRLDQVDPGDLVALDIFLVAHPDLDVSRNELTFYDAFDRPRLLLETPECAATPGHVPAKCACLVLTPRGWERSR